MVKDIFTLPLSFVLECVCIGGGGEGGVFGETDSRDRRAISSKTGQKEGFRLQEERERTCLQAKNLTRGHVLIINDHSVPEMPPYILTVIIGLNWGDRGSQ